MAIVTQEIASMNQDQARFFVTFDDATGRISSVELDDDLPYAIKLSATDGSGNTISQVCQPGQRFTYTLKNNERYFIDQWTVTMGAA